MAEGIVVEYICRVIDETDGQEAVPQSSALAQNTNTGKSSVGKNTGKKSAETASKPKTSAYFNAGLQIGMPAFNALTGGLASNVVGHTRNIITLGSSLAQGGLAGGGLGAIASLGGYAVSQIVNAIVSARQENDQIAQGIEETNKARASVGLSTLDYSQTWLTRRVRIEGARG